MKSINTISLRITLGALGMALPWIVLLLCVIYDCAPGDHIFPDSISATYYFAPTITPFMIILGASGVLLMCYRGYTWVDDLVNTLTGIFALGICLFPCGNDEMYKLGYIPDRVGTFQVPVGISDVIHSMCAIAFFVLLAYNVLFLFTKSSGNMTRNKKIRNIIYRVCGVGMLIALAAIVVVSVFSIYAGIWWIEAIALGFFGIAFLTKADVFPFLFCDSAFKDDANDNA